MTLAPTRADLVRMNVDLTAEVVKLRGQVEALQNIRVTIREQEHFARCVYCGTYVDSAAESVEHAARCEKHPAVKRMKAIRDAAAYALDIWTAYLKKKPEGMTFEYVDIDNATRRLNYVVCCDLAMERNSKPDTPGQYPDPNRTVDDVLGFFADAVERAVAHQQAPKGGMQVPFNGDFIGAPMSTLIRLQWWIREFRDALERAEKKERA